MDGTPLVRKAMGWRLKTDANRSDPPWPLLDHMPGFATGCEAVMSDPLVMLGVAVALAAYLIYALIYPEKF
jgi:K+-transporting ATPase KdpF subunit